MNKSGLALTLVALSWKASIFSEPAIEAVPVVDAAVQPATEMVAEPAVEAAPIANMADDPTPSPEPAPIREWASNFEYGIDYTRVSIRPSGSSSFDGNLWGAQGIYEYTPKNNFYGAAKLAWKQGDTLGSSGKRYLVYVDTQERLGYSVGSQQKNWIVTFYSGLGFRYLGQTLYPKTSSSLKFNYNEFYVPVGVIAKGAINSWFTLGGAFTWMPQIFPTVSIVPLKGTHWSLTNTLNNYFVELIFDFNITQDKCLHISFNPFYERWQDGHSTAKTSSGISLGLPGNTYNFWGADLNVGYRF